MRKNYLIELLQDDKTSLKKASKNKKIIFEMPPFCSGDYIAIIHEDQFGLYINANDNFFKGCRDYEIK